MALSAQRFLAIAALADVAPLTRDGRAAFVVDRSGTDILWTNAAGLGCLGRARIADVAPLPASGQTARRIAAVASRLSGASARAERIPLPIGIIPVQAVCQVSRIAVDDGRAVLIVVIDGTGRLSADAAAAGYEAILAVLAGTDAPPAPPAVESPAAAGYPDEAARDDADVAAMPADISLQGDATGTAQEIADDPLPPADAERQLADEVVVDDSDGDADDHPDFEAVAFVAADDDEDAAADGLPEAIIVYDDFDDHLPAETWRDDAPTAVPGLRDPVAADDATVDLVAMVDAAGEAERLHYEAVDPSGDDAADDEPEGDEPADDGQAVLDPQPDVDGPMPLDDDGDGAPAFRYPGDGRTVRFVFELDPQSIFTFVSPEFAEAVGPGRAEVVGRRWSDIAVSLGIDPLGRVGAALARRDTFTGLTVDWPVQDQALRVPVDLAGMPVFARDRAFRGWRGFGLAKCGAAFAAAVAVEAEAPEPAANGLTAEEIALGTTVVEAETEDTGLAAEALASDAPILEGSEDQPAATLSMDDAVAASTETAADSDHVDQPDEDQPDDDVTVPADAAPDDGDLEAPTTLAAAADTPDDADAVEGAADDDVVAVADADTAPPTGAADRPADPPRPEPADDLGDDWPGSDDDMPEPEPDTFDGGPDDGETDPSDLAAMAALDAAIAASVDNDTPSVEPSAPDAAPGPGDGRPRDASAGPGATGLDLEWRDPGRPTGEVILSPIVPRSVPASALSADEQDRRRLSRPEREAFQKIAEALGARFDDAGVIGFDDETESPRSPSLQPVPVVREPSAPLPIDAAVLDRLPVAVAILKEGEAVLVNRAFLDLAGYADRGELEAGGGFAAAFAGSTLPRDASLPAIRRRDGVEIPVSARLHSVPWRGGIASLLVVQETAAATGRDRADAAEARLEELEAILDTATDGVIVLDPKGTVLGANRSAEALFGTDRSEMVGDTVLELLAPESHRAALDYLDGLSRNGVASVLNDGREVIGRVRQGGLVPLFMTVGRISATKFCAVLRDITQWKRAEEELTAAKRSAEHASSQKSDFLAKISHEIRTPLNAIIGFSEVMMEERFGPVGSERYKEYLRDIHLSGAHIMSLVNDLLDLSKIEAGKLDLAFEAVSANEVIRECVALMQPQANRERVIIRTSLSSSLPNVVADSRSLRQIVLNLLSNAIKFNTPGGQVIVSTLYEETGEVAIRVRDTGAGMSEEDVAKALEPFRQLHTTRAGRGTGLGLPLTKALVEANRAVFRIESTVGQGTLVQVTFPSTRVLAE